MSSTAPSNSENDLYTYKAKITSVYDGDTVTANVDLGFKTWAHGEKIRLYRINTPEVRGVERPQGLISRDWLREKLMDKEVLIRTVRDKKGKYGRYLAEIFLDGVNINEQLVEEGLAEYKEY
ncbi:MAG: thermonuclease family protein [Gammaproteobacteria bacterium]|nr:thermonuclease family protein [Gammaproteobacteria bacterium]